MVKRIQITIYQGERERNRESYKSLFDRIKGRNTKIRTKECNYSERRKIERERNRMRRKQQHG